MKTCELPALTLAVAVISAYLMPNAAHAKPWWVTGPVANEHEFLPPDVAFRVAAHADGTRLHVRWVIADGYYLYRSKLDVKAESPGLELGTPSLPRGSPMTDEYFGAREVYLQQVEALIPYARLDAGAHPLQIRVSYQGCAMAGLCYPVIVQVLFPDSPVAAAPPVSHPWEGLAIGGGLLLFFGAGVNFRKTRRPAVPGT